MNTNQGNKYQITISDKQRLQRQIDLYGAYLSQYKFKNLQIDPMKVNMIYDTLRITVDTIREKSKLKAAINDLNTWAHVGMIISKAPGLSIYVQVHRDSVDCLEYRTIKPRPLNNSLMEIMIGLKDGSTLCNIPLTFIHNVLLLSGPRMGKTNSLRVMSSYLKESYPDVKITIFTKRKEEFQDITGNVEYVGKEDSLSFLEDTARYIDMKHLNVDKHNDRHVVIVDELYDFFNDSSQVQWNRIYAFLIKAITHGGSAGVYWLISTSVFHNDLINERFLKCFNTRVFLRLPYLTEACRLGCENAYHLSSSTGDALLVDDAGETRIHIPYKPLNNI